MPKSKLLIFSAFLVLALSIYVPTVIASSTNTVTGVFVEAEDALSSAYATVLDAEQAGANVSVLLDRLNLCGDYLSEAYFWHSSGDSGEANRFASLCYDVAEDVKSEAFDLKDEAESLKENKSFVTVIGSGVAVLSIVVLSSVIWRLFKRSHYQKVLRSKPEVVS